MLLTEFLRYRSDLLSTTRSTAFCYIADSKGSRRPSRIVSAPISVKKMAAGLVAMTTRRKQSIWLRSQILLKGYACWRISRIRPHPAAGIAQGVPRSTGTRAAVSRACVRQRIEDGPSTKRFRSVVSGEQEKKQFHGSLRMRDSTSGQVQKPIQSAFGWETGGRPQRPKTPIQNEFGWGMGLDGNGWACREALTIRGRAAYVDKHGMVRAARSSRE